MEQPNFEQQHQIQRNEILPLIDCIERIEFGILSQDPSSPKQIRGKATTLSLISGVLVVLREFRLGDPYPFNDRVRNSILKFERSIQSFVETADSIDFYSALDFIPTLKGHSPPNITDSVRFYHSYINPDFRLSVTRHLLIRILSNMVLEADFEECSFPNEIIGCIPSTLLQNISD